MKRILGILIIILGVSVTGCVKNQQISINYNVSGHVTEAGTGNPITNLKLHFSRDYGDVYTANDGSLGKDGFERFCNDYPRNHRLVF